MENYIDIYQFTHFRKYLEEYQAARVQSDPEFTRTGICNMLGLPKELYTPIFATARISGWSAHRIEELMNVKKIIRPAYMSVCEETDYTPMSER